MDLRACYFYKSIHYMQMRLSHSQFLPFSAVAKSARLLVREKSPLFPAAAPAFRGQTLARRALPLDGEAGEAAPLIT